MDTITIKGLRHYAYHGVLEAENQMGQLFIIDLACLIDLKQAIKNDDYQATICYQSLCELALATSNAKRYRLIETLAGEIASAALAQFDNLTKISVTIHKPAAPVKTMVDDIAVTVERQRLS